MLFNLKKISVFLLGIVLPIILAIVCMREVIINNEQAGMPVPNQIDFTGEYSYDGENWYTYDESSDISAFDGDIIIKGHLNTDISEGTILNFYCNHIGSSIYVNGKLAYIDTPMEIKNYGIDLRPSMCGKRWEQMKCPKITPEDEIEFHFINHHKYGNKNAYKEAVTSLLLTPPYDAILEVYLDAYVEPFEMVGYALLIVALMLLGASFSAVIFKSSMMNRLFKIGIATLFVGGYMVFDVMMVYFGDELLVVKTYGGQLSKMLAVYFIGMIVFDVLKGKNKKAAGLIMGISAIINIVIIIATATGKVLLYDTEYYWKMAQYIISFVLIALCILELINAKKFKVELVLYTCVNVALIIDMLGLGRGLYYSGIYFKVTYVVMLILSLFIGTKQIIMDHHASIKNKKLKEELEHSRISVMLSQIQPHFLYNSLTSVMDLCDTNPKQAKSAIADFADYLRGNLSSLKTESLISFKTELEHIEKYLRLEKLRFNDELEVVFDIQTQDFMLPPLTVQPLVENAVKHGVGQKIGGGTVTICTCELDDDYIIRIKDDGVGFDESEYLNNECTHIGIENAKKRLDMMIGAKLEIESNKGEGTIVTIYISKRRD